MMPKGDAYEKLQKLSFLFLFVNIVCKVVAIKVNM